MRSVMKYIVFVGLFLLTLDMCNGLNRKNVRSKVSKGKKDVAKRETNPGANGDFYPDWVPFKKNIDELGELVESKRKPKKRLALPASYVLKAVAENDDLGILGEVDGDEEYEKKEWSDVHRSASGEEKTEKRDEVTPRKHKEAPVEDINDYELEKSREGTSKEENEEDGTKIKQTESNTDELESSNHNTSNDSQSVDYEEVAKAKERKEKVLNEVDDLKQEHADEQRLISARDEEDRRNEAFDREFLLQSGKRLNGYRNKEKPEVPNDYDDLHDVHVNAHDKYAIHTSPKSSTLSENNEVTSENLRTNGRKKKKDFRSPETDIYNNVDDSDYEKYVKTEITPSESSSSENVRISLVPQAGDSDEPTTFHIKKRKPKRRRKPRVKVTTTSTSAPDAYVAETMEEQAFKDTEDEKTSTTREDTVSTNSDTVTDAVPASSDHKKTDSGALKHEKGGGKEFQAKEHSEHEEHGKKAYQTTTTYPPNTTHDTDNNEWKKQQVRKRHWYFDLGMQALHENSKSAKGYHDKEGHSGSYKDAGGHDKSHHKEGSHYGSHHHEEEGKKDAKYEESGKHSKGHSTKGTHNIHKKDEFEKKIEFFEEDGDSGEEEKHGGYQHEKGHAMGGHFKKGGLQAKHIHHEKGDSGHFIKGGHVHIHKGHKSAAGHDSHGNKGHDNVHIDKKEGGKKWLYHHGHPAKTANLILIDRRTDRYTHGPLYFGKYIF